MTDYVGSDIAVERFCITERITPQQYRQLISDVLTDWELAKEQDRSHRHMVNAIRKKISEKREADAKAKRNQSKADQRKAWEDDLMAGAMRTINEIYNKN